MRARPLISIGLLVLLAMSAGAHRTFADWSVNGVALCDTADSQGLPRMIPDGSGGAIIVWQRSRAGGQDDIYAQRVTAQGLLAWSPGGVPICLAPGTQSSPVVTSDGAGGAIVAWQDGRQGDALIYAQRVLASGACSWSANGVPLGSVAAHESFPGIASDGVGGAIVAWNQFPGDIFVQHIDNDGAVLWDTAGVALCGLHSASDFRIGPDGIGGAIVAWRDNRAGIQIYAARVQPAGTFPWTANGVAVTSTTFSGQYFPAVVSDGLGGAIVAWTEYNVHAQRINASGTRMWGEMGQTCAVAAYPGNVVMVSDGAGGAIMAWEDGRYGDGESAIFTQRMNAAGVAQWNANGIQLTTTPDVQYNPAIVGDGGGGAIVVWSDCCRPWWDIYAQRLNSAGTLMWNSAGSPICTEEDGQYLPAIVSDGAGGAIVAWNDRRNSQFDVYAQRIYSGGGTVAVPQGPPLDATLAWPNPASSHVRLAFHMPVAESVQLEVFDVQGRRIWASRPESLRPGSNLLDWDGDTEGGRRAAAGVYYLQARGSRIFAAHRVVYLR